MYRHLHRLVSFVAGRLTVKNHSLLVAVLLLCGIAAQAQTIFPVQSTTRILPPYSVYLADYAVNGNDKLQCILVNRDATQTTYQVRLRLTVKLNGRVIMQTSPSFNPTAITLSPNIAQIFAGATLEPYLKSENLDFVGYSQELYEQNRALPEGFYEIGFAAFDYYRQDVQVSNDGYGFYFLAKNEPPLLNMPSCGSKIQPQYSSPIRFSWMPRNTASLNSGNSTYYRYFLYEINPRGTNPNDIANSLPPIYVDSTPLSQTFYDLMPTTTLFRDTFEYVWRVQAVDINGADLFRNNGLSEVCTFTWGGPGANPYGSLDSVLSLNAIGETERKGKMWWTKDQVKFDGYKVYYKKSGSGYNWFTLETDADTLRVFDLEPDTEYECRIQGRKNGSFGMYSAVRYFRTKKIIPVECNNVTEVPLTNSGQPLINLLPGAVITYRDFEIKATDSIVSNQTGWFSGKGEVSIPFLGGLVFAVKFNNIYVDNAGKVSQGEVQFVSRDLQTWWKEQRDEQAGGNDVGDVVTGNDATDYTATYDIPSAINIQPVLPVVNGVTTIVIARPTPPGGNDTLKNVPLPYTIKDKDGDIYSIDKDGKVTKAGKSGGLTGVNQGTLDKVQLDKAKVIFKPHPAQLYAFDAWQEMFAGKDLVAREFEKLTDSTTNTPYYVPNKAVAAAKTDKVIARIEITDNQNYHADSVKFVTRKGTVFTAAKTSVPSEYELTIVGGPAGDAQELFALHPKAGGGYTTIGKLKIAAYSSAVEKLVIIPVGINDNDYNVGLITQKLSKVYGAVNVKWDVRVDTSLRSNVKWDLVKDGKLDVEGSGILADITSETREMKELKYQYKISRPINGAETYVFLLHKSNQDGIDGGMPRGKRFGYIFIDELDGDKSRIARTITHEVGHGRYLLRHTFSEAIDLPVGTTKNIMDYRTGNTDDDVLYKYQWDQLFDPGQVGLLEGDDENQSHVVKVEELIKWLKQVNGTKAHFNKLDYFEADYHYMYLNKKKINGKELNLFVEINESGEIDLAPNQNGAYGAVNIAVKIPEMGDGLHYGPVNNMEGAGNSYHAAFYIGFNYTGTSNAAIKIYTESYTDYEYLLSLLGISLTDYAKNKINDLYTTAFTLAGDDCDKLDVIYENIPDFVIGKISDVTLLKHMKILTSCAMSSSTVSNTDTDEEKGVLNILQAIKDKQWLYTQFFADKKLVEELYYRMDGDNAVKFWTIVSGMCNAYDIKYSGTVKEFIHIGKAGDEYLGHIAHGYPYILDENKINGNYVWSCYIGRANLLTPGTFENRKGVSGFTVTNPLQPIRVHFEAEDNSRILPAGFAYLLATRSNRDEQYKVWLSSLNYLGVSSSIRILFTKGSPKLLRAIALIDLSKTVINSALEEQAVKDKLNETPAGQWLLSNWSIISTVTDITVIGGDLIFSLAKNGRTASNALREKGKTEAADDLDAITRQAEEAVGAVSTELASRITTRVQNSTGYLMRYTNDELATLIARGKNAGIEDQILEDMIVAGCRSTDPVTVANLAKRIDNFAYLRTKGYYLIEETDDMIFFKDANNRAGKVTNKNDLDNVTWFSPQSGGTWPIHETNCTNYLKFRYGNNKVSSQVKVRIHHGTLPPVECYLDDVAEIDGRFIISDAKHSQKAAVVDGKIPGYTANQTKGYQWIADGNATRIEVIGDGGVLNGINRGDDLLPVLDGKVRVLTNDSQGQIVEMSILRTKK